MMSAANSGNSGRVVIAFRNGEEKSAELDWHYDDGKYQVAAVGGGVQYYLPEAVIDLVNAGHLEEVDL